MLSAFSPAPSPAAEKPNKSEPGKRRG